MNIRLDKEKLDFRSLRVMVPVVMLLVALIPLGSLGVVSLRATYLALEKAECQALKSAAKQTAILMDVFAEENLHSVRILAGSRAVRSILTQGARPVEDARVRLGMELTRDPVLVISSGILNAKGINVLDSDPAREGDHESGKGYFQHAITASEGFMSETEFDAKTNEPHITFSHPVIGEKGNFIGAVVIRWSAMVLQHKLSQSTKFLNRSERCLLVDAEDILLADALLPSASAKNLLFRPVNRKTPSWEERMLALKRLHPKGETEVTIAGFPSGEESSESSAYVLATAHLSAKPWRIIYLQSADVFAAPVMRQIRTAAMYLAGTALIVAAIAALIAQFLTRPLVQFTRRAEALSRNERDIVFEAQRHGEIGILATALNSMVANLKQREEALRKSRFTLGIVLDLAPVALVVVNRDGIVQNINGRGEKWFGISCGNSFFQRCQGKGWFHYDAEGHPIGVVSAGECPVLAGTLAQQTWEEQVQLPDGMRLWLKLGSVSLREVDLGAVISAMDISEMKASESLIMTSLREKEVLLREIHHRVKNNLQVVHSMLGLQAQFVRNREDEDLFRQSQSRVRSMALVHERLYKADDFAHVDFGTYVRELSSQLLATYRPLIQKITLDTKIDPVAVPLDHAVPCALILNELISNALKHAFLGRDGGHVRVELSRVSGRRVMLRVSDNGCGWRVPAEDAEPTLGVQLIRALVSQLRAEMRTSGDPEQGTTVEIEWTEEIGDAGKPAKA